MIYFFRISFVLFCVFFSEAAYFSYILTRQDSAEKSDVILVFMGAEKRIETGYQLANQGLAPAVVLSPANAAVRRHFDSRYALTNTVSHIPETDATTTFENALYTSRIITAHQYNVVTLVTSDYHMPRSLALLHLFLLGDDVRIHIHMVRGTGVTNATRMKLVYNEMVEFWGSLFEYADYQIRGKIPEKPVKKGALSLLLRSVLLLNVNPSW